MLYKLGTLKELDATGLSLPECVRTELTRDLAILDCEYGAARNWQESGGYSVVLDAKQDLTELAEIIDYSTHPCEWATRLGSGWMSSLFLLGDDYAIVAFMPIAIAPNVILADLEDET